MPLFRERNSATMQTQIKAPKSARKIWRLIWHLPYDRRLALQMNT
jgi:hypothetical protein